MPRWASLSQACLGARGSGWVVRGAPGGGGQFVVARLHPDGAGDGAVHIHSCGQRVPSCARRACARCAVQPLPRKPCVLVGRARHDGGGVVSQLGAQRMGGSMRVWSSIQV